MTLSSEITAVPDTPRRSLRIAMIAPPYFTVPPEDYGGVESVIADLVDGLVDRGHHVSLVGAGGHGTKAQRFLSTSERILADELGRPMPEVLHVARAAQRLEGEEFDIVHDHTLAGPLLARFRPVPTVVTVHGPPDDLYDYYRALGSTVGLVSISRNQQASAPDLPWLGLVHNGIDVDTYPFSSEKEDFCLFLGRYSPEKAPHLAIDAARAAGLPIVLAAKCNEPTEEQYFEDEIRPRLGPGVTDFGIADAEAKRDLLSRACCLLFPICWEEPFGLVMIEAMACGTPVVAFARGSVPEVVVDGVTGVIVEAPDDLPGAISRARELDAAACREHVRENFSTSAMAARYEAVYQRLVAQRGRSASPMPGHADLRESGVAGPRPARPVPDEPVA